jgi:hypothetical protein
MVFLIAAALMIALLAGALIEPLAANQRGQSFDPYAPEMADWSISERSVRVPHTTLSDGFDLAIVHGAPYASVHDQPSKDHRVRKLPCASPGHLVSQHQEPANRLVPRQVLVLSVEGPHLTNT